MKRSLLLLAAIALLGLSAAAQAPVTGTPNWYSFKNLGFETVDRANLDVHFTVPIYSRPGRIPFSFGLVYDSLVWAVQDGWDGYTVLPAADVEGLSPLGGWTVAQPMGNLVQTSWVNGSCGPWDPDLGVYDDGDIDVIDTEYSFTDPQGVGHDLGGPQFTTLSNGGDTDGTDCPSPSSAFSYPLTDGSGLTFAVDAFGNGSVYDPQGNLYQTGFLQDRNGNAMWTSVSGDETDYFDTLSPLTTPVLKMIQPSDTEIEYEYQKPDSSWAMVTETLTSTAVESSFGCAGVSDWNSGSVYLPTEIELADGTTYTFAYTNDQVSSVKLPSDSSGTTIEYTRSFDCDDGGDSALGRWNVVDGLSGGDPHWAWSRTESGGTVTTTETSPSGDQAVIATAAGLPSEIDSYSGTSGGGTLLETLKYAYTTYAGEVSTRLLTTILPSGGGTINAQHEETYDTLAQKAEVDDYDWASGSSSQGTRLRKAVTAYEYLDAANNTLSDPMNVKTYNSGDTLVAETDYGYDESGVTTTSGTPNYDGSIWAEPGNLTSVKTYTASGTSLTQSYTYFDTGAVHTATDAASNTTTYALNTDAGCKNSFPASVSLPVDSLGVSLSWNCTGGVVASTTDANGETTDYSYADSGHGAWGPSEVDYPDGGQVNTYYTDHDHVETVTKVTGSVNRTDWAMADALGRPAFQQAANGTNCDTSETVYDANGRVHETSAPYAATCTSGTSTPGGGSYFTTLAYDGLDRPTSRTLADGSATGYAYTANSVEETDAAGVKHIREVDGLARLADVCEVSSAAGSSACGLATSGSGFLTSYAYNEIGKMTGVSQSGQTRSFTWDWAGRLTSETNPESGETDYSFDSASDAACPGGGTSTSAGDLILVSNAASESECMSYDGLHRLTRKGQAASGTATTTNTYSYDSGTAGAYGLGRLAEGKVVAGGTTESDDTFAYDTMGRPATVVENPAGSGAETASYTYNLAGEALTEDAPSGRDLDFAYDTKARLASVQDNSSSLYYLTSRSFNAADEVTAQSLGYNGSTVALGMGLSYNETQQPWALSYTPESGTGLSVKFHWGSSVDGSGNVSSEDNNGTLRELEDVNASSRTVSYAYDDRNRMASAESTGTIDDTFTIDPYGNRDEMEPVTSGLTEVFTASTSTNRVSGMTYNGAGQLTAGTWGTVESERELTWDANGLLQTYSEGGTLVETYVYDAFGRRVASEPASGTTTYYYYGASDGGHPIAEYTGGWRTDVVATGTTIATVDSGGTPTYLAAGEVGSTRQTADSSGTASGIGQLYPYGEVASSLSAENQYTNQIRDANGLDHFAFRTYASTLGRWLTPDPAGLAAVDPNDPQTWDRYNYVGNQPVNAVDPLGLLAQIPCPIDGNGDLECDGPPDPSGCAVNLIDCVAPTPGGGPSPGDGGPPSGGGVNVGSNGPSPQTPQIPQQNACTQPILDAVNNQFGTNFAPYDVTNGFPNGQAWNITIQGNGLSAVQFDAIQPGRYPTGWISYIIGYGSTLHITGQSEFDPPPAEFANNNVGGATPVIFTAHLDTSFAYNPIGFVIHLLRDMLHLGGPRNSCP